MLSVFKLCQKNLSVEVSPDVVLVRSFRDFYLFVHTKEFFNLSIHTSFGDWTSFQGDGGV